VYKDKNTLNSFAKIAVDSYLGSNKSPLNESLKKIASSEELTPSQIQYVAAEANKGVWQRLFGMDKTASYEFPLADAQTVIEGLSIKHTTSKVDLDAADYHAPPMSEKVASFDPFAALGIVQADFEKTASASARKAVRRQLEGRYEKLAQVKEEIFTRQMEVGTAIDNAEREFVKSARELLMEQPLSDRPAAFAKLASFVNSVGGKVEHKVNLMRKFAHVLQGQGLVKKADLKAPEEYISESMPAQIINGRHPLYITIKTIMDNYEQHECLHRRHEIVDSSLPVIKEKIRAL
jgi:hypothetical protein